MVSQADRVKGALLGLAIGDALGVPVEFTSRCSLEANPVVGMRGYGTHNQSPGTWSDDTSLSLCLAESITHDLSLIDLSNRFINWYNFGYWTPHGHVFDVGIATRQAIDQLQKGTSPRQAGLTDEYSNGNGSLMRILPLVFHTHNWLMPNRVELTSDISSLTHRHIRSIIACVLYIEYARLILGGMEKFTAYMHLNKDYNEWLAILQPSDREVKLFNRITQGKLHKLDSNEIKSSGYVVHTLEASLWCFLTTNNYQQAVLQAVNLGEDTDTIGAITGGLAGLYYGQEQIPTQWLKQLVRQEDIQILAERLASKIGNGHF